MINKEFLDRYSSSSRKRPLTKSFSAYDYQGVESNERNEAIRIAQKIRENNGNAERSKRNDSIFKKAEEVKKAAGITGHSSVAEVNKSENKPPQEEKKEAVKAQEDLLQKPKSQTDEEIKESIKTTKALNDAIKEKKFDENTKPDDILNSVLEDLF